MVKNELADVAAPKLLDWRSKGVITPPAFVADEFWCSAMSRNGNGSDLRKSASSAAEPVCGKLRVLFDDVTSEPMPDSLANLCDRLDHAFERGELFAPKPQKPRR